MKGGDAAHTPLPLDHSSRPYDACGGAVCDLRRRRLALGGLQRRRCAAMRAGQPLAAICGGCWPSGRGTDGDRVCSCCWEALAVVRLCRRCVQRLGGTCLLRSSRSMTARLGAGGAPGAGRGLQSAPQSERGQFKGLRRGRWRDCLCRAPFGNGRRAEPCEVTNTCSHS
jgi:hypothetical protein